MIYTQQVLDFNQLTDRQRRWENPDGLCAAGSWGAELFITPVPRADVVVKHRFDCWQSRSFTDALKKHDIDGKGPAKRAPRRPPRGCFLRRSQK